MRKHFRLAVAALALAGASATVAAQDQLAAGTWTIGTTLMTFGAGPQAGLQVSSGGGASVTRFGANGAVGYLMSKQLELGGNVLFGTVSGGGGASFTTFGIGPYVRYWLKTSEKGGWNVGGQINIFSPGGGASNVTNFGAFGGYSFFVNNGISLDLVVPIQISSGGGTSVTTFGFGFGVTGFLR